MSCFLCDLPYDSVTGHWACPSCQRQHKLPKLFIGICGRARNGKDFIGSTIKARLAELGIKTFCDSVSSCVFEEAKAAGLINRAQRREDCDRDELDTLVDLGHRRRAEDEDHWLRSLSTRIIGAGVDVAIIPGIRFPNEINWLRRARGTVIKVTCLNADGSPYISPDRDPNDPMETVLNRIVPDYEITAVRGQQDWLAWQGIAFTNFIVKKYFDAAEKVYFRPVSTEATAKQVKPQGKGRDITELVKSEALFQDFLIPEEGLRTVQMWIRSAALWIKYGIMNPLAEHPVRPKASPELIHAVIRDFEARAQMGEKKYGARLHAFNNRSARVDLLQELYDAWLYARQHQEDHS